MKILAYINTYNRTDKTLPLTILSIINQTVKPTDLIIWDDNKETINPNTNETLRYLLEVCMEKGIQWYWNPGEKKGAHFNHEKSNMMDYDLCWFLDDDQVAEPNCLEELLKEMKDGVGAVGGIIKRPWSGSLPANAANKIENLYTPNIQWFNWKGEPKEVEHIYSSFLYRPKIVHHDLRLSKKVFRGETMFTHSLLLKGYKLIVTPNAITHHFESSTGGCRTKEEDVSIQEMYDHDQRIFEQWLAFKKTGKKIYMVDAGLGDHYIFLQAVTPEKGSMIACCYPEVFEGMEYELISIAEAEKYVSRKEYDAYDIATMTNFKGSLLEMYKKIYEDIN